MGGGGGGGGGGVGGGGEGGVMCWWRVNGMRERRDRDERTMPLLFFNLK